MKREVTKRGALLLTPIIYDKEEVLSIEQIITEIQKYNEHTDKELILRAYNVANDAHKSQKRASGEGYIMHPLAVAKILTSLQMDDSTIAAAILHDVVEDSSYTQDDMKEYFGEEVSYLIDGVTKLSKLHFRSTIEAQSENYRKLFLAMAKDLRVIMIKLADRLHNMRTLRFVKPEKQERIARETIEVYAPLANRLGISNIKWELEDLCFRYLEPEKYYTLAQGVLQKRQERQTFIEESILEISKTLEQSDIKAELSGRAKHYYSIYKKMKRDNKEIGEIYDLSALRILVDNVKDCYHALGVIHTIWKPLPGRFKDYIAMPKSNGYQSLHTTVMAKGYPLEIQIRTFMMHTVSEYGVAAHWKYKEAGKGSKANQVYDKKLSWLRQITDLGSEVVSPGEYVEALKMDFFTDEVLVFTPTGDVIDLPKGAVPIDFAYRIHTDVGNHCTGAMVNGKMVPLSFKLSTGDRVEIITSKNSTGPKSDWLNIVSSADTRSKIRAFFKKANRKDNIQRGLDALNQDVKKLGYETKKIIRDDWLAKVAPAFNLKTGDDLLASIGYGVILVEAVLTKLIELYREETQNNTPDTKRTMLDKIKSTPSKNKDQGILVEGNQGMLVRLARCCSPIPGDPILGYITKGRGISVHRADCPNVRLEGNERYIDVAWDINSVAATYAVEIQIALNNQTGVLNQVLATVTEMRLNVVGVNARVSNNEQITDVSLTVEIKNSSILSRLMTNLRRIKDVYSVSRTIGKGTM